MNKLIDTSILYLLAALAIVLFVAFTPPDLLLFIGLGALGCVAAGAGHQCAYISDPRVLNGKIGISLGEMGVTIGEMMKTTGEVGIIAFMATTLAPDMFGTDPVELAFAFAAPLALILLVVTKVHRILNVF